jgi:hypothetical protein
MKYHVEWTMFRNADLEGRVGDRNKEVAEMAQTLLSFPESNAAA